MDWLTNPSNIGIVHFATYLLGTILTILFPGPNSLYVLAITSQKGWRAGAGAALGIFIGDAILILGVILGAATLLNSSPVIFNVLRLLGAAYLGWMGISFLRTGIERWRSPENAKETMHSVRYFDNLHPTLAALALSLTNPKAIFFFVSFFTQFIDPQYTQPLHAFLYLAVVLQIVSMSYLASLIFAGYFFLGYFKRHPDHAALLWGFVGLLLLGFAVNLLL
ncbi:leucine efflux protein LeuE [Polynucleobacter antarcticus]|uniref:Leucine efflux protein LeuE n=1 Tax=Polynucleobacter antarcticus TaxID=1743162 RepID=A0A6M9PQC1_9BURK|nr:leucine efflux protein LeuE [Polynucleobacter antarcticus]QKM62072.1 leucine efflux protein LeuE [Polynucleobacter antarcticus]